MGSAHFNDSSVDFPQEALMSRDYVSWLKSRGIPLFEAGGHHWMLYHRALKPATTAPCYLGLTPADARDLFRASGALLLRYSSDPCEDATEWWYIVCEQYDPKTFSSKTRSNINRGKRECRVSPATPEWIAENGYGCYAAAHTRYKDSLPVGVDEWRKEILAAIGGPAEYWTVFVGEELAAYCKCTIEGNNVDTTVYKFDPKYFKHRPANALLSHLGEHYVVSLGRTLSNGNRGILHDTNMQDFLLHHGFRKQFCRLNVVYRGWLEIAVKAAYPLRRALRRLPETRLLNQVNALLAQEEIKRACCSL